ncbi:4-hydroxy-2-oxoglutarate aldolase [Ascochyta rabiei]|nr:4-hydroxy-2-oxoglutarate aldolase [Ascochyta rabiei]UPX16177.1 4-hydroxy-2-oxoglutarate aldolase [Ascochyta rabiei]
MAKRHSNAVGVKLTCGSVAKTTRLAAAQPKEKFAVFGGQADFIVGGLSSGSSGCIAAFANVAPRCIVRINELYHQSKHAEALALHQKTALAEHAIKGGIAPTKYAAAIHSAAYAGIQDAPAKMAPHRPYVAPATAVRDMVKSKTAEVGRIEQSLPLINRPISPRI